MKNGMVLLFCLVTQVLCAQTPVQKSYPVQPGQRVDLSFDYPELVRISTWDKNEVQITGSVNINLGENDDAFELLSSSTQEALFIENRINGLKSLPQLITIVDGGKKLLFRSNEEYKKYASENGKNFDFKSWGVEMEIVLDVKIPRNAVTNVKSVYGMVEVRDFNGPLTVEATYGGVDAALREAATGQLSAQTNYGQIYSNLAARFDGESRERDFHTYVSAKIGSGPNYAFASKYGNVYLRKETN